MTLPSDYIFREGDSGVDLSELREIYRDIASAVNGFQIDYQPYITGQTTPGSKASAPDTYVQRSGLLQITQLIADVWFDVQWTDHDGSGPIQLQLPAIALGIQSYPWVSPCLASNIAVPVNAGGLFLQVQPGNSVAILLACIPGAAPQPVQLTSSGRLQGYLRFACQLSNRP